MEHKRIKVRLTKNSPYSDYGYYKKGDIGYIDGYVNDSAVIILENGKFAKSDLGWIEVVNEEDENVNLEPSETDDERIRKALIEYLRTLPNHFSHNGSLVIDWIAWLERQAQKPAWSEKDKNMLKWIIGYLENKMLNAPIGEERTACKNAIAWFKKLEGEQKPAWSEEDESKIRHLIAFLDTNPNSVIYSRPKEEWIDWLKSLRPQNRWKPSEREKEALLWCVVHLGGADKQTLGELLEELNKL